MTTDKNKYVGQSALIEKYGLQVPSPSLMSVVGPGARKTTTENGVTIEKYTASYAPKDTLAGHLKFSLRYEPTDLGVLSDLFKVADHRELEDWIRSEPNGAYSRRAWFLYEWLTDKTLDIPDLGAVTYINALDEKFHITATDGRQSRRHKVIDNLLGTRTFCPTVRRTEQIKSFQAEALNSEASELVSGCDPDILTRAVNFLYTKETKSTFQIENEVASGMRAERFVAALRGAEKFDLSDPTRLLSLQNSIVDPRYAATGIRDFQNFIGETAGGYREIVHFICPKPEDVPSLLSGWADMASKLRGHVDPVVSAALVSFGFVFIHPFEDGNGRIHRFLMHNILSSEGYTPKDVLFPISAAIVRDRRGYDAALESFSAAIQPFIEWSWTPEKEISVKNDTCDLYRYFDATTITEYLYSKIKETVRKDLRDELSFIGMYDAISQEIKERIDMPDRRASLLAQLLIQGKGALSQKALTKFSELTELEIKIIQKVATDVLEEFDLQNDFDTSDSMYRPE
ncbi:Fic family protein [uncultured Roseibium sp.]|uniref:Fic family protein n=1 Tax=uncultured Roseibium sp. TaxID=1936171 RepID=UPI002636DB85|nr:Fic family protein [uncultured Roseibium sp.]